MTDGPLKILLTVDPEIPVPPRLYGGIERIVDMLCRRYEAAGHEVHLAAHPDSRTAGTLHPWPGLKSASVMHSLRNTAHVRRIVKRAGPFDVIHSFARLAFLLPVIRRPVPKIQSYQRHVTPRSVRRGVSLSKGTLAFTGCSDFIASSGGQHGGPWYTVHNGVPVERYDFVETVPDDAPLAFLGRLDRIKGADLAIDVAERAGRASSLRGTGRSRAKRRSTSTGRSLPGSMTTGCATSVRWTTSRRTSSSVAPRPCSSRSAGMNPSAS